MRIARIGPFQARRHGYFQWRRGPGKLTIVPCRCTPVTICTKYTKPFKQNFPKTTRKRIAAALPVTTKKSPTVILRPEISLRKEQVFNDPHTRHWYLRPLVSTNPYTTSTKHERIHFDFTVILIYMVVQQGVKRVPRRSLRPHLAAHIWKMMWAILYNQCNMSRIMNYLGAMIATLPRMKCYTQEADRIILYASTRWTRLQTCNCLINEA